MTASYGWTGGRQGCSHHQHFDPDRPNRCASCGARWRPLPIGSPGRRVPGQLELDLTPAPMGERKR